MSAPQLLVLEMLARGRIGINDAERLLTALKGTAVNVTMPREVMTPGVSYFELFGSEQIPVMPIHR